MITLYCSHGTGEEFYFIAKVDPDKPLRPSRDGRRLPPDYTNRDREANHDPTYPSAHGFYCHKCKRHPQLNADAVSEIVRKAHAAGLHELDVSKYPFAD